MLPSTIKAWVDGTLKINTTDSTHAAGGVALGGDQPKFDNLRIGYDNNVDDDIDDADDDLVVNEDFASTNVTVSHDDAGNLIDDGTYGYTYDAWHRLVKVQASADSRAVTIQTAEFDPGAPGRRRIQKVVTNSGNLDATTVYLYDGHQIIETRDGSSNVVAQFIHGTQYIDELVMARITGKGDFYYHQDANFNVIALTDLGGSVLERYDYTAYGEMTVHQETSFGDRDGDQDVDSADKGTVGVTCTGTVSGACRILDLDFDGDYDATDATAFDALDQGLSRHPGRTLTGVDQPFGHQGLYVDGAIGTVDNRAREYDPATRRFMQRDPLGYLGSTNAYEYVASSPLVYFDPLGLLYCWYDPVEDWTYCGFCDGAYWYGVYPDDNGGPSLAIAIAVAPPGSRPLAPIFICGYAGYLCGKIIVETIEILDRLPPPDRWVWCDFENSSYEMPCPGPLSCAACCLMSQPSEFLGCTNPPGWP